jgi:ATP-dependent helicase/nuclease subunit A
MAEPNSLRDVAARAAITERLDDTLFVEAGAGTGKTTALVSRILELVRSGRTSIGKVAAITFTEAAAADLRSKVHLQLTIAARGPDGAWARAALGDLDEASMTTIHGFAQRILSEHTLAARLPLRFRVMDEVEYDLAAERRFRDVVEGLVTDDELGLLIAAALAVGISFESLSELAGEVDAKWDRFVQVADREVSVSLLAGEVDRSEAELAVEIGALLGLRADCDEPEDGLVLCLDALEKDLASRSSSGDWVDRLSWCCAIKKISCSRTGSKIAWKRRPIEDVRERIGALEAQREAIVKRVVGRLLSSLVVVFAREAATAAQRRRNDGELGFHDLLVFAYELLRSNPQIAREISERYSHILVDEFQDTDPLQLEIVTLLAEDPDGDGVAPGKLFFVGDPHQSIYRFRGAEPDLYERALERLVPSGPLLLTSNFRSVPAVLGWVNGVFGRLFGDEGRFHPLAEVRAGGLPAAVRIVGAEATERASAHDRRVREAREIAVLVARCVREEWPIEASDGTARPAGFGDIAILVTKRTGLAELEDALDEFDIPFRADSPSLILRSAEVRDFLSCLFAIDAPGDEVALVRALRTPLLACGDDDLWRYRQSGGRWNLEHPDEGASGPVESAMRRLRSLADRRHDLGLLGTMHALATELKVFEAAATSRHNAESLRRLLFLFARASAFADAGGSSLSAFVEWIDEQSGARVRGVEAAVGDADGAVRVLTIHAAKGLEFPVVFLAELASDPARQRAAGKILFAKDGRPEIRIRREFETPGYAALYDAEVQRAGDELVRLLYVAMTRARDHLVVSLHRSNSSSKSPSLAHQIAELLSGLEGSFEHADATNPPEDVRESPEPTAAGPAATKASFARWRAERKALCEKSAIPSSIGARTLEGGVASNTVVSFTAEGDETVASTSDKWRSPRGASAIGRAVHGVLQRIDLAEKGDLADLVISESVRAGCSDAVDTVATLVADALDSDEIARAASATLIWRELPVSVPVGDGVLDGVIDLAYETGDGVVVVDYKTDAVSDEAALAERVARYRTQAGAYAYALGQVLGRPIAAFRFLFLRAPGGARAIEIDDLDAAADEAVAAAERSFAAPVR